MNSGENIIYLGSTSLIRLPGARNETNDANLTVRTQSFAIAKTHRIDAIAYLIEGLAAPGFPNLRLFTPPFETFNETHCFFECRFHGVLSVAEGGRPAEYEYLDKLTNLTDVTIGTIPARYVQPVYRYQYTIPKDAPDRNEAREINLPETVSARNTLDGSIITLPASSFFWEFCDLERINYGEWDTVRESWKLSYKFSA